MNEKCITIHQPWASLILIGEKKLESRNWRTKHKGKLWIHSSKEHPTMHNLALAKELYPNVEIPSNLPLGCILGSVVVGDIIEQSNYINIYKKNDCLYRHGWLLKSPHRLRHPIPITGRQSIYTLPQGVTDVLFKSEIMEAQNYHK